MKYRPYLLLLLLLCSLTALAGKRDSIAYNNDDDDFRLFSGFSGGMMLHVGYAFSSSPQELFRNASIASVQNLPKDGMTVGIGGAVRVHLLKHLRVGGEGFVSTMPLMKSGSSIRTGWGGVLADCYWKGRKITPFVGGTVGGGSTKRLYVPGNEETVVSQDSAIYNSSYTKTPFFFLDPYVGIEWRLTKRINCIARIDWMLPFGKSDKGISAEGLKETIQWSNFISPSGPRLYLGFMFNH